jgi:hypothetical protein
MEAHMAEFDFSVTISKVDTKVLGEHLAKIGVKVPKADADSMANALIAHYRAIEAQSLARCENCNGLSDPNLDVCPYCGHVESLDEVPLPEPTPVAVVKTTKKSEKKDGAAEAQEGAKNMSTETTTDKKSTNGVAKKDALAKAKGDEETKITKAGLADLDKSVSTIRKLMTETATNYWHLGKELNVIHEKQLWKQRTTEDGKVAFKSFDNFVSKEIGWSAMNAYRAIDVAKEYSESDVRKFGMTKLSLVLEAPKEARAEIEEGLKKGATYRETKEKVKEARAKAGTTRRETGRKKTPAGEKSEGAKKARAKAAAEKGKSSRMTIANIEGTKTVRLYAKGSDDKPAKKVADLPWGQMELSNDVVMQFAIVETTAGELVLRVKVKRGE